MRKIDTYLSVDLDYWGWYYPLNTKSLYKYLDRIFELTCPIHIVTSHEDILNHLNKVKAQRIINIDYHADIVNEEGSYDLNDGTWANFYKYRNTCTFEWRYRFERDVTNGRCDDCPVTVPFINLPTEYKSIEKEEGLHRIRWFAIEEVCIVTSPDYWHYEPTKLLKKYPIFKEYF